MECDRIHLLKEASPFSAPPFLQQMYSITYVASNFADADAVTEPEKNISKSIYQ